jgi:hypothetical protein
MIISDFFYGLLRQIGFQGLAQSTKLDEPASAVDCGLSAVDEMIRCLQGFF